MALQPCKECGHQVSTSARACPSCGGPVVLSCPTCGEREVTSESGLYDLSERIIFIGLLIGGVVGAFLFYGAINRYPWCNRCQKRLG
jgi:hypothetical protein